MRKRVLLAGAMVLSVMFAAMWFAAEESYVLRLNAKLGTALNVDRHGSVAFGHVYGQEIRQQTVNVALSNHAMKDPNFTSVLYQFHCKGDPHSKFGPFIDPDSGKRVFLDNLCGPLFVTIKPTGTFFTLRPIGPTFISHTLDFVFPDCKGSVQPDSDKAIYNNCDQETSVLLGGQVKITRVDVVNTEKKIECLEKDDPATWDPRCFE